jgi:hypothetical protein
LTSSSAALQRRLALVGALIAVVLFGLSASPGNALAGVSGQLGVWGKFGPEPGKLLDPAFMGVDTEDGSVFVGSYTFEFDSTRIEKFSESGTFEGAVSIPGIEGFVGIAVDSAHHRFYVLESAKDGGTSQWVASRILAFKTAPNASGELEAATVATLPVPSGANKLVAPREIVVDPSTGDLVILAKDESGKTVLQRIAVDGSGAGTVGAAFVDTGAAIGPWNAIAISPGGLTYVVSANNSGGELHAATLPAGFSSASTLTSLPGFSAAVGSVGSGSIWIEEPSALEGVNYGPQVTVTRSSAGEETLFWKSATVSGSDEEAVIHGYSVNGQTLSVLFGGGATEGSCKFSARRAALTSGKGESLVVLDQGVEVFHEGEVPPHFPIVSRFGPGGSGCPAPAPAFKVESAGHVVTSVPKGATVRLEGAGTELNGATLEEVAWKVSGAETFTETGTALTTIPSGRFETQGTYTIRPVIKTTPVKGQAVFAAPAQTLVVTAPGAGPKFPLNLTPGGTGSGTFRCKVEGGAEEACAAEYEAGKQVEVVAAPNGDSEFSGWTADCLGTGTCKVKMSAEHVIGAVFVAKEFALTVTPASNGTVRCDTGAGAGACAARYPGGTNVTLTPVPVSGFEFDHWTGDCSGSGPCVLAMHAPHTVGAAFKLKPAPGGGEPAPGGGGSGNGPGPGGSTGGGSGGGGSSTHGTLPPPGKTPAQKLAEKRRKAIAKCKKLKGRSKVQCLKKANQIGKPKPKPKKK